MRKHNIHSPSDVEIVVQLVKKCCKQGRDFPVERLPVPGAATPRGDLKYRRLHTTRSEGASVRMQERQWHTAGCEGL